MKLITAFLEEQTRKQKQKTECPQKEEYEFNEPIDPSQLPQNLRDIILEMWGKKVNVPPPPKMDVTKVDIANCEFTKNAEVLEIEGFQPTIKIDWFRGYEELNFKKALMVTPLGKRGSGKSNVTEWFGESFLHEHDNSKVIDLFGARDDEAIAWLRSEWKNECLLIHGDSVHLSTKHGDVLPISKVTLKDFDKYRVVLTSPCLYGSVDERFIGLEKLMAVLDRRKHWEEPWYLDVREAGNFIYSRLRSGANQSRAKADFVFLAREARHMGLAMGIDMLRETAIDVDVRTLTDFVFIKQLGIEGLRNKTLSWLYRYIDPISFNNMPPERFIIVSASSHWGIGELDFVPWHKQTHEDIEVAVGLKVHYDTIPDYGNSKGTGNVSDFEHADMIELKMSKEGATNTWVASQLDIRRTEGCVRNQIKKHNKEIEKRNYCSRCKAVGSQYQRLLVD